VVEDNPEVAEVAAGFLEQFGYRVRRAANARAALDALAERPDIDLVFSDVVMPGGMNGMELAATLRARSPDLPVVLTTGYSEAVTAGPPAGVRLLRKPYGPEQLEEALRASLEAKRSRGAALVG
jgi:CheY-like chemotaxis protein